MPSTIASGSSWVSCRRSSITLAVAGLLVAATPAAAGIDDCNNNGIPDAAEIAAGLIDDCNGNGVPDPCEYAGVVLEASQAPFGGSAPLVQTFPGIDAAVSDVRLTIEARADHDAVGEFVTVKVGGTVVASLWVSGGQACPATPQVQTLIVPLATFNAAIANGALTISLEPSALVSPKECPGSSAWLDVEYVSDVSLADCNGNLVWDVCEIAADPSLDCNGNSVLDSCDLVADPGIDCDGNGLIDSCEIAADPSLDCNGNSVLDSCDLAADPGIDCDGNGLIDSCEIAADPSLDCAGFGLLNSCMLALSNTYFDYDCDGNGVLDACQINAEPSLDKNDDGILDPCQYARGDFNLDRVIDGADLSVMLSLWGTKAPPFGDLTGDGVVNGADLANLLGNWGSYQGPWGVVLEVEPEPAVITDPEWRERIVATGLPWRVQENASGIEMLLVPPGTFMMGCSPSNQYGCGGDENPVHEVTLTQAFYLGRYEVTQAQWTAVMGSNPSSFQGPSSQVPAEQVPNRPVERVSWNMIQGFEAQTGLRLPTEAEWEYACRAGTMTAFNLSPNGTNDDDLLGQLAWFNSNAASQTRPVGQKQANNLGLHDMHGNVWEWVEDWYGSGYYAQSPAVDPPGPISGSFRVLRGGSWYVNSNSCRASYRRSYGPGSDSFYFFGLRAARTP